jgi:hypothetical protein
MTQHVIHYVKREIKLRYPKDPKADFYKELQAYDAGFDRPFFHKTRSGSWPIKEIKPDDIIWLVSQLHSSQGKLPVSLDARIIVGDITEETDKTSNKPMTRFAAQQGSCWLPLYDASETLSQLETVLKDNTVTTPFSIKRNNLGQAFQSIRKVHNPEILEALAQQLQSSQSEFISYRIMDGTQQAFELAQQRLKEGMSVFWDRWGLPRRLAERRELVADDKLDQYLLQKLSDSSVVWGVESDHYGDAESYAQKEKRLALSLNKYRAILC